MIHITFKKNHTGFKVEGHAEYAQSGRDIVCSAISAMAQQTVIGLEFCASIKAREENGLIDVQIYSSGVAARTMIYSFKESCNRIQEQYPKYVQIEEEQ